MSNSQTSLGKLITETVERDAVHIAVAPVVAAHALQPGEQVGFIAGDGRTVGRDVTPIGIVDPFLTSSVKANQRFWLFLFPNTITSLKHVWTHPSFSNDGHGVASESEKWLRDFADQVDADYEEMMRVAETHCDEDNKWGGDYLCEGGKWEGQYTPDEFWVHFAAVTGKTPKGGGGGIFSCAC